MHNNLWEPLREASNVQPNASVFDNMAPALTEPSSSSSVKLTRLRLTRKQITNSTNCSDSNIDLYQLRSGRKIDKNYNLTTETLKDSKYPQHSTVINIANRRDSTGLINNKYNLSNRGNTTITILSNKQKLIDNNNDNDTNGHILTINKKVIKSRKQNNINKKCNNNTNPVKFVVSRLVKENNEQMGFSVPSLSHINRTINRKSLTNSSINNSKKETCNIKKNNSLCVGVDNSCSKFVPSDEEEYNDGYKNCHKPTIKLLDELINKDLNAKISLKKHLKKGINQTNFQHYKNSLNNKLSRTIKEDTDSISSESSRVLQKSSTKSIEIVTPTTLSFTEPMEAEKLDIVDVKSTEVVVATAKEDELSKTVVTKIAEKCDKFDKDIVNEYKIDFHDKDDSNDGNQETIADKIRNDNTNDGTKNIEICTKTKERCEIRVESDEHEMEMDMEVDETDVVEGDNTRRLSTRDSSTTATTKSTETSTNIISNQQITEEMVVHSNEANVSANSDDEDDEVNNGDDEEENDDDRDDEGDNINRNNFIEDCDTSLESIMTSTTSTTEPKNRHTSRRNKNIVEELYPVNTDSTMTASEVEDNLEGNLCAFILYIKYNKFLFKHYINIKMIYLYLLLDRLSQLDGTAIDSPPPNNDDEKNFNGQQSHKSSKYLIQQREHKDQHQNLEYQHITALGGLQSAAGATTSSSSTIVLAEDGNIESNVPRDSSGVAAGGSGGDLDEQDMEEVLKVLKGLDGGNPPEINMCDFNVLFNEVYNTSFGNDISEVEGEESGTMDKEKNSRNVDQGFGRQHEDGQHQSSQNNRENDCNSENHNAVGYIADDTERSIEMEQQEHVNAIRNENSNEVNNRNFLSTAAIDNNFSVVEFTDMDKKHMEIEQCQDEIEDRIDGLLWRMRKLQSRYMCKHTSEEIAGLFEYCVRRNYIDGIHETHQNNNKLSLSTADTVNTSSPMKNAALTSTESTATILSNLNNPTEINSNKTLVEKNGLQIFPNNKCLLRDDKDLSCSAALEVVEKTEEILGQTKNDLNSLDCDDNELAKVTTMQISSLLEKIETVANAQEISTAPNSNMSNLLIQNQKRIRRSTGETLVLSGEGEMLSSMSSTGNTANATVMSVNYSNNNNSLTPSNLAIINNNALNISCNGSIASEAKSEEVVVPTLEEPVVDELNQVVGLLESELTEVQKAIDSDVTESSSCDESADEIVQYSNSHQQKLPM